MADKFKRTNKANIGDIVIDANHPAREFQVDGYSHEIYTDANGEYEEITYDVYDVETCEFLIAFEEDLTVVVKAEMADDYLRSKYGINASKPSDIERKIVDDILREFQVDGYSHEIYTDANGEYEEITYDVYDVETCEFLIAFEEDLTVVVKAEMADDYLRSKYGINASKPSDIERKIVDDILREFTAKEKEIREAKPINNKAEVSRDINDVDTLLDEINDYKTLIKMFGDENKKYELAICEAKAKLKELTEGGR